MRPSNIALDLEMLPFLIAKGACCAPNALADYCGVIS